MIADGPVVTRSDVDAASPVAIDELDTTFFRVRFERTTPFERRYLRAMAERVADFLVERAIPTAARSDGPGAAAADR